MLDCTAAAPLRGTGSRRPTWFTHTLVVFVSLIGGALGIGGAFVSELHSVGAFILLPIIGAPVIEEAFKPIGVFLSLSRWPHALTNRLHRAVLCAGAGIVFGLIESAVYVWVYAPDAPDWVPIFRFTVPVALHAVASFTVGLGLDRGVVDWVNHGTRLPRRTLRFYIAGAVIHAVYNTTAVILAFAGVLDF